MIEPFRFFYYFKLHIYFSVGLRKLLGRLLQGSLLKICSLHNCLNYVVNVRYPLFNFVPDSCRSDTDRYDPSFSGLRIATTYVHKTSQTLPHYITFLLEQYSMTPDTMPTQPFQITSRLCKNMASVSEYIIT